jgi:hypothetical protein
MGEITTGKKTKIMTSPHLLLMLNKCCFPVSNKFLSLLHHCVRSLCSLLDLGERGVRVELLERAFATPQLECLKIGKREMRASAISTKSNLGLEGFLARRRGGRKVNT